MRTFIGIGLPDGCRRAIDRAVAPFRSGPRGVSWTPEENLHVTMKFLGEIASTRVDAIASLMADAAREIPPVEISVEGAGGFPSPRDPRVLWVAVRDPLELVGKLHENMETALSGAGFPREGRPFHPHVTVGRVRKALPPGWAEGFFRELSGVRFGSARVTSCRLYESRLSPGGAAYAVLRDVPLGG